MKLSLEDDDLDDREAFLDSDQFRGFAQEATQATATTSATAATTATAASAEESMEEAKTASASSRVVLGADDADDDEAFGGFYSQTDQDVGATLSHEEGIEVLSLGDALAKYPWIRRRSR